MEFTDMQNSGNNEELILLKSWLLRCCDKCQGVLNKIIPPQCKNHNHWVEGVLNLMCFYQTTDAFCNLNLLRNDQCWTLGLRGTLRHTVLRVQCLQEQFFGRWGFQIHITCKIYYSVPGKPPKDNFYFSFVSHLDLYSCQCALPSYHLLSLSKVHLTYFFWQYICKEWTLTCESS